MPKKMRSCVFLPSRKEGEELDGPSRHISVTYEKLARLFHLPLKHAAREIGLSQTTFKTACRRFNIKSWPFRTVRRFNVEVPIALRNAQAGDVDAVLVLCQPAGSSRQTPELHQSMRAVTVSSTPPLWRGAFSSIALGTQSYGEARHVGPAFQPTTIAPHDAQSYIDPFAGQRVSIGAPLPMSEGLPPTLPCGGEQGGTTPLETGSARERSCVEAVMEYLDLGFSISEADVESMLSSD